MYYVLSLQTNLSKMTRMPSLLPALVLYLPFLYSAAGLAAKTISLGLLNGGSNFFLPIRDGFEYQCKLLGVECHVVVAGDGECQEMRQNLIQELLSLKVDGIAMKPCGPSSTMEPVIDIATNAGVPVVTFDSDVENSTRVAYVGTDNRFMGRTMARLVRQLRPEGGTYGFVRRKEERVQGFIEEISKYNGLKDRAHWYKVPSPNFVSTGDEKEDVMLEMQNIANLNVTVIVTTTQSPMRHPNWTDFVDKNRHRGITLIGVDGADYQLDYLNRRYVDGLVGQLPYEIGSESFQVLYDILTKGPESRPNKIYPTNIVSYNVIPIELPPVALDENLIGNLKYLGYICFSLVALFAMLCIAWTFRCRSCAVVKMAQPFFLIMVAVGVLIMASSLIPLSLEKHDSCDQDGDGDACQLVSMSETYRVGMCMSIPWLAFTGFTVVYAALFSKTWRVTRLFFSESIHSRVRVTETDVLPPFVLLLTCNIIVLTCWTVLDPLTYIRQEHDGTDYWNRAISTFGSCRSDNALPYLTSLAIVNFSVVAIACWQAIQARNIKSEFSESKYIGLTVASLFQAFLTGIPVAAVVRDNPRAFYVVLSLIIFLLSMVVLLLIFLPKMTMQQYYSHKSETEQRRMITNKIRASSSKLQKNNSGASLKSKELSQDFMNDFVERRSNQSGSSIFGTKQDKTLVSTQKCQCLPDNIDAKEAAPNTLDVEA